MRKVERDVGQELCLIVPIELKRFPTQITWTVESGHVQNQPSYDIPIVVPFFNES